MRLHDDSEYLIGCAQPGDGRGAGVRVAGVGVGVVKRAMDDEAGALGEDRWLQELEADLPAVFEANAPRTYC